MKIEVLKENFKNGLSAVERVVGKNLSLPILDNVLLDTEDNFLSLSSTDLETAVKLWMLAKIVKKGKSVVPVKFLSSFVSSLPNEKIILEQKEKTLNLECKNFKTQLQGFNPEDFPLIPQFKDYESLEVDGKKVSYGLSQIVDVASPSQNRPEISGILFYFSKNILKIVATDSFRLAEKNITLESPAPRDISFIIPQKPAREIMNILESTNSTVKIYISPNQAMFEIKMKEVDHPQVQIVSRLIEGEYPNYEEIIPNKFKTKAVVKRDEFLSQVKTASLFSGKINEVRVTIDPAKGEVEIFAKDADVGQSESVMQTKSEGEKIQTSFNYKFLADGLLNIKSSEVSFELSREDGACILRPVGDTSYIYVVMPIKSA